MCGIIGYFQLGMPAHSSQDVLEAMSDCLRHRGPDSAGMWSDDEAGIGLGHRRLSILDLSQLGNQPMTSAGGRYVIVYNGEIYNFAELREFLSTKGHQFRSNSDTEVMLAAICEWGIAGMVRKLNGMFAFAIWDRQERELHLGRDRIGIKPLYYGLFDKTLIFASELTPLTKHPSFRWEVDQDALTLLMRYNYITQPYTIYNNVMKIPPGTVMTLDAHLLEQKKLVAEPYWSLKETVQNGLQSGFSGTMEEAKEELEVLLKDAVTKRMVADVPLGAFLSGGIDSSLVVSLMQAQSTKKVKTFSIGFWEEDFDEAKYARKVAEHLGTDHTAMIATPEEAMSVIPELPSLYDEPFGDSSNIPTHLVSKLAREQVTVSLSGDGGDELFAGYTCYRLGHDLWPKVEKHPALGRRAIGSTIHAVPDSVFDYGFAWLNPILLRYSRPGPPSRKFNNVADLLSHRNFVDLYSQTVSAWYPPTALVLNSTEPSTIFSMPNGHKQNVDLVSEMMYWDTATYLPDDILVKVDRASMAVSLEARVPLLDHRVVEFAWRLPVAWKYGNGSNSAKRLLRSVLYDYVPAELFDRPKQGFTVPLDTWLRADLRDWAEDLLTESKLRSQGYFNVDLVRNKWADHLSGQDVG